MHNKALWTWQKKPKRVMDNGGHFVALLKSVWLTTSWFIVAELDPYGFENDTLLI